MANWSHISKAAISDVTRDHVLIANRVQLEITFSDLASSQEDVVVNSTGVEINLKVSVSKAIADNAGPKLAQACATLTPLNEGTVVVTSGFDMHCTHIIHCNSHYYQHDGDCQKLLHLLAECLNKASSIKATSIALPAVGMGVKGYPSNKVADTLLQAAKVFVEANPSSTLVTIKLYLHKPSLQPTQLEDFDLRTMTTKERLEIPVKLKFIKGDLAEIKADVIVNSTGYQISLKDGLVATALLNKAGYALQSECTRRAPLNVGDVIVTDGYGLDCDNVLHVNCPPWKKKITEKILEDIIGACMDEADSLNADTMAFCALGTGLLQYPADRVAACFIKAVTKHDSNNPDSTLKKILVVAYDQDDKTIKKFEETIKIPLAILQLEESLKTPVIPRLLRATNGTKLEIDLPMTWEQPVDKYTEPYVIKGTTEWHDVETDFFKTLKRSNAAIINIKRVQNPDTYFLYEVRRQCIARSLGKSEDQVETAPLWHGAKEEAVKKITCSKFDRGLAGDENGAFLGRGSYFASNAEYSSNDKFSQPNGAGERYMIQVRVLTGEYCLGSKGMKSAPYKPGSATEQYDCVVDSLRNPQRFCVFHDDSAYPEYIIKYKY